MSNLTPRVVSRIPQEFIDYLRKTYNPVCMSPEDSKEHHLFHAGKVSLAQQIIRAYEQNKGTDLEASEEGDPFNVL